MCTTVHGACVRVRACVCVRDSPMAWYLGDIVVGWCSTRISASNSQDACGLSLGDTITMPFLMVERLI